jgi:hypothetical protein
VHSNVKIRASVASGGRSLSQHSQFGRSSRAIDMVALVRYAWVIAIRPCGHAKEPSKAAAHARTGMKSLRQAIIKISKKNNCEMT